MLYQLVQLLPLPYTLIVMAGRSKLYDEEQALDRALNVFWLKGYENASAQELLEAMGIGKGSFYLAYKNGKQELFEKSLIRFFQLYHQDFIQQLARSDQPLALIKTFFYRMSDPVSTVCQRGCYFANTVLQAENPDLKQQAGRFMQQLSDTFTQSLLRTQQTGRLAPELVGPYLLNLWSGLNISRNLLPVEQLRALIDVSFQVFD